MSQEDIDSTQAPLVEHLTELRQRLIYSTVGLLIAATGCFILADHIFNILLYPYERATGNVGELRLIFTAPQEYLFTQFKIALFGGLFLSFPVIATQLYKFVAPGLYKNERGAFLPFLIATPILFLLGVCLVYFLIMPLAMTFFLAMQQTGNEQQAAIELMPRVSEYLSLIMTLIFAFGLCFQLPVVLTLLARTGLTSADGLRSKRKYAIMGTFIVAAILTPPDPVSQLGLAIPTLLLYELSIFAVVMVEKKRAAEQAARDAELG